MKNKNNEIRYICQTPYCRGKEAFVIINGKGMCFEHWNKYAETKETANDTSMILVGGAA